jgi:hypothetical protein
MLKVGDEAEIIKSTHNGTACGQRVKIIRTGFGSFWVRFQDGQEKAWRKSWLKKIEVNSGTKTSIG